MHVSEFFAIKIIRICLAKKFSANFIHNAYIYPDSESDLAYMRNGRLTEIEIKSSKQDFKNDSSKTCMSVRSGHRMSMNKHEALASGLLASEFYFAAPRGLILRSDIPEWAGLIEYWQDNPTNQRDCAKISAFKSTTGFPWLVRITKQAPSLHDHKATKSQTEAFYKAMNQKLWERGGMGASITCKLVD